MGNCLIKGSQICSQTCPSLALVEGNAHHSFESESIYTFIYINDTSEAKSLFFK